MNRRAPLSLAAGVAALALAALALAALALAAPSLAAAPSVWGKSADAICARYDKQINRIPEPSTLEETVAGTQKLLAIGTAQMKEIARLPRPAAAKADIARLLVYYRQQLGIVGRLIAALKAGDQKQTEALIARGDAVNKKMIALGLRLGTSVCSKA